MTSKVGGCLAHSTIHVKGYACRACQSQARSTEFEQGGCGEVVAVAPDESGARRQPHKESKSYPMTWLPLATRYRNGPQDFRAPDLAPLGRAGWDRESRHRSNAWVMKLSEFWKRLALMGRTGANWSKERLWRGGAMAL